MASSLHFNTSGLAGSFNLEPSVRNQADLLAESFFNSTPSESDINMLEETEKFLDATFSNDEARKATVNAYSQQVAAIALLEIIKTLGLLESYRSEIGMSNEPIHSHTKRNQCYAIISLFLQDLNWSDFIMNDPLALHQLTLWSKLVCHGNAQLLDLENLKIALLSEPTVPLNSHIKQLSKHGKRCCSIIGTRIIKETITTSSESEFPNRLLNSSPSPGEFYCTRNSSGLRINYTHPPSESLLEMINPFQTNVDDNLEWSLDLSAVASATGAEIGQYLKSIPHTITTLILPQKIIFEEGSGLDIVLSRVSYPDQLAHLTVRGTDLSLSDAKQLSSFPILKELHCLNCRIDEEFFSNLILGESLSYLSLKGSSFEFSLLLLFLEKAFQNGKLRNLSIINIENPKKTTPPNFNSEQLHSMANEYKQPISVIDGSLGSPVLFYPSHKA